MKRFPMMILTAALSWAVARAVDPPHDTAALCASCHMPHQSPGGALTTVAGNANLCISCHQSGGTASASPFANADQASPRTGFPSGQAEAGTSHRWDAGAAGRLVFLGGAVTPSTGSVLPSGVYTGAYAKTYTITLTLSGPAGSARFNWSATSPGGGSGNNLLTAEAVALDQGILVGFQGTNAQAFQAGDQWNLHVRAGLRNPTLSLLQAHSVNGVATCSACHDSHSQAKAPFDPAAPAWGGAGTGEGRRFMRANNDQSQLCTDCHASLSATNALAGTHPVAIPVPSDSTHHAPGTLPLEKNGSTIGCLTCHQVHFGGTDDGKLLRGTNQVALCVDCHQQSDVVTPAAHFVGTNVANLWPGGRFGSQMPARTHAADRGSCLNCHAVHGWPNAANPSAAYPKLLADFEENLCFTCHGTNGPAAKLVLADFQKAHRHPVLDSEQKPGREVECEDCHNPHEARSGGLVYNTTATSARNRVSGPLRGVAGVSVDYTGLANFAAVPTNRFTGLGASPGATYEYEVCFKCHTGYAWGTGTPPNGSSPNGSAATPVETDMAQEFSPMNRSGHPIVTGLDSYPNSVLVGGKRGLLAAAMKAPWNVNLGTQTMTCTDCHTSDAASPAAQGPHGSASQYMLRGPNAANWPNVTLANINSSWCMNCHNNSGGRGHTEGDHSGARCYVCHIVIPHGGKVSRLIADGNSAMPARYAYNNNLATVGMLQFKKAAVGSYTENSNCRTSCGHHGNGTGDEDW